MPENEKLTALDMARNALANMAAAVEYVAAGDTDPEKAILARIHHVSQRADQDSKVAARMALVSIAEDLHDLVHPPDDDMLVDGGQIDGYVQALALVRDLATAGTAALEGGEFVPARFGALVARARTVEAVFDASRLAQGLDPVTARVLETLDTEVCVGTRPIAETLRLTTSEVLQSLGKLAEAGLARRFDTGWRRIE